MKNNKRIGTSRSTRRLLAHYLILLISGLLIFSPHELRAQQVSIQIGEGNLDQAFQKIMDASSIQLVYNTNVASTIACKAYTFNNKPINEILTKLLEETNLTYTYDNGIYILQEKPVIPQTTEGFVSGQIFDETGETIIGATVIIKGTVQGTVTDINGNFRINHIKSKEDNIILQISFVGKKSIEANVKLNSDNTFTLQEDSRMISEVIVTGYQDIKKEKMTGSVNTIRANKIEERYTPNLAENLEGRVAGLSTYGGKLTIRGTSSLYAETSPLLVVDGIPIEGDIDDINPYNIESINVLKDAAASAIYGARASNGIIVITTKNAKKEGKIDINFSANVTCYEKKNMDYADNFYMTPSEQVDTEAAYWDYYYFNNDGEVKDPLNTTASKINGGTSYISPIQWIYYQHALGKINKNEVNQTLEELKKNNFAEEYGAQIYRRQIIQQYNLALRGRSELISQNLILNYRHDNAGQINSHEKAININYKGSYSLASWLTATASINSVIENKREPGEDYSSSHTNPWAVPAYESMFNEDGSQRTFYYWFSGNHYWDTPEGYKDLGTNITDEFYNNTQTTHRQHMRYHGELLFKLIDGLTINTQFVYETENTTMKWYANPNSHVARTIYNAYTIRDTEGKLKHLTPTQGGMLCTTDTEGKYWTARGQVNFVRTLGKHHINALAGLEFRETLYCGSNSLALGYDDQLQNSSTHTINFEELSQMSYNSYYMASGGGFPASQFAFEPYIEKAMLPIVENRHRYASGYANLTYTYDDKYNIFASFRKDYADVYGLNAKFRGKPLWSIGAGWNLHYEDFMQSVEWINFLKLRISYGITGNIYQGATSYLTATSEEVNSLTNLPQGQVESPANPNLKWEQNCTINYGIDFAVLNNRITGTVDYYIKKGKDIFSNRTLDPTTGFSSMFVNMASMQNKGLEMSLTGEILRASNRKGFNWEVSTTFSYNKNEVTKVENPTTLAGHLFSNPFRTGYPTSAIWSYRFAGISDAPGEQGQTLWYVENNGKSHTASGHDVSILEYSGQQEPKIIMGLDSRFTWQGFTLGIQMSYYGGHKMRALAEIETFGIPSAAIPSYFNNAWTPENPTNTPGIGRYTSSNIGDESSLSNISVHPADFIKIRNIVIGYDLPQNWVKLLSINRLNLSFQINNPKYLWVKNKIGVDPETLGIRNPSSYVIGLNINL